MTGKASMERHLTCNKWFEQNNLKWIIINKNIQQVFANLSRNWCGRSKINNSSKCSVVCIVFNKSSSDSYIIMLFTYDKRGFMFRKTFGNSLCVLTNIIYTLKIEILDNSKSQLGHFYYNQHFILSMNIVYLKLVNEPVEEIPDHK